jgi:hypothetical protein
MVHGKSHDGSSMPTTGFEKKGGYPSTGKPVSAMPKVPAGPAPGSRPTADTQQPS